MAMHACRILLSTYAMYEKTTTCRLSTLVRRAVYDERARVVVGRLLARSVALRLYFPVATISRTFTLILEWRSLCARTTRPTGVGPRVERPYSVSEGVFLFAGVMSRSPFFRRRPS